MNRPKDMLEFLRRASTETPADEPAGLEPTPRVLVFRRSQVIVAGAAAACALVLAFLVGFIAGGADGSAGGGVYVIRAAAFGDDESGLRTANTVRQRLEDLRLGEEVRLVRDPADKTVAVTVGGWREDPARSERAQSLLRQIQTIQDKSSRTTPFRDATFWRIER